MTAGNRDLGIDRDAPRRVRQSGADWFDGQDAAVQRAMLGPGGYDLYRRGASLRDFVGVHDSPDWGPTLRRKPLGEVAAGLRARSGRRSAYPDISTQQLREALALRGITEAEIAMVHAALSRPDPAGVLAAPSLDDVRLVAAYLNKAVGRYQRNTSPTWTEIERGHAAARVMLHHELRELAALEEMAVKDPLVWRLEDDEYRPAHARATWEESEYWTAWARAEGHAIPPEAFFQHQPERVRIGEIGRMRGDLLDWWDRDMLEADEAAAEAARRFYRRKGIT